MDILIGAIVVVFVLIMGFRAFTGYSSYKGTLYQQLFSSYLEYFWRMSMQRDLSRSSYLQERIGPHRIVYNAYRDGQGRIAATFATVFSTRGTRPSARSRRRARWPARTPAAGRSSATASATPCPRP